MKRTYSTGFKDYKFSKLYLDEINDILNFIEENNYSHKIKINNFEIENSIISLRFRHGGEKITNLC